MKKLKKELMELARGGFETITIAEVLRLIRNFERKPKKNG